MKKILLFLLMFGLLGCNGNKPYKYVEIVNEKSLFGNSYDEKEKEPIVINAKNDSLAYLEAYKRFCISQKVRKDMADAGQDLATIPLKFSLYNSKGEEVYPYIESATLDSIKKEIMKLKTGIKESLSAAKKKKQKPIDSVIVKKLSPLFNFEKDEFDPNELTWIKPKSAPQYIDQNGIYCYFMKDINGVSNFRLRIQYHADDWLFIRKYQFSIDGKAYEFIPNNVETDSGNGGRIWEWCDEEMTQDSDIEIIKALSMAKKAKIKFIGRQYHNIRSITKQEINGIKDALDLYNGMGGGIKN